MKLVMFFYIRIMMHDLPSKDEKERAFFNHTHTGTVSNANTGESPVGQGWVRMDLPDSVDTILN